jgi:hypothetical protein
MLDDIRREDAVMRAAAGIGLALLATALLSAAGCAGTKEVVTEGPAAPAAKGNVVTVDLQGNGDYRSIQAAVDAAPAGGTVHVRAGIYHECVELRKSIVLEGEGPDKTTIASNTVWAGSVNEFTTRARQAAALGDEEGRAAFAGLLHAYARPAVFVSGAEPVTVRDLKLTLLSPDGKGLSMADGILMVDHARLQVEDCVLAGAWAYGLKVSNGTALKLRDSLVAGVVTSGVYVGGTEDMGAVEVSGTDFRRCGVGVQVASGCPLTVEGCRFLMCDQTGMRFEQAAPVVRHCAFIQCHQGMAGWSDEAATVQGNVFALSDGFGVTVGSPARTLIEQNSFASNAFGVVMLKEPYGVTVRANIFMDDAVAVLLPGQADAAPPAAGAEGAAPADEAAVTGNLFWHNSIPVGRLVEGPSPNGPVPAKLKMPEGNFEQSPMFRDAADLDYSLLPGSPALRQEAGALEPLPSKSPWPAQPEETQMPRDANAPLAEDGDGS